MPHTATPAQKRVPDLYNLYIYTNEECNLACKHCWVTAKLSTHVPNVPATLEMYRGFIEQAIPLGLGYVKITGGEAFLRREDVLGLIKFTHEKKIATRIETNGTLIDDEVARVIAQTGTAISISLDGSNAEVHERMRLVPGCFNDTIRGIELLKKHDVPIEIIMSVCKENEHDLVNVIKIVSTIRRGRLKINPVLGSGRGGKMDRRGENLSSVELYEFVKRVETDYIRHGVPILVSSEPAFHSLDYIVKRLVGGGKCGFKSLLGILSTGNISFCGMGYKAPQYLFGHVSDIDLAEVWLEHPGLREIRDKIPQQLEGICGNCVLKNTCQGACRANAYETYGSITAPSAACQGLYDAGYFPKNRMIDPNKDSSYRSKRAFLNVLN